MMTKTDAMNEIRAALDERVNDLAGLISSANVSATEYHIPVVEFAGNGDDPEDI